MSITSSKLATPSLLFAAPQLFIPFPPRPFHPGVHPTYACKAALWIQVGWSWGTFGSGAVLSSAKAAEQSTLSMCSHCTAALPSLLPFAKPPAEWISCYFL